MSSQLDALVGREIDGYYVEKSLGAGGMARVYLGRDVRLDRYVAFKVIQPQARNDAAYTSRFIKEARSVAGLNHPNIVNIYRFGEVDGLYYMAMQYIEGADLSWVLKDYVNDQELMPLDDVLRVVSQVAAALDYAHAQGVIHRDVKPANVMLDQTGRAYLMDFGLALRQVEGTYGEIFGTPHYIAPEQAISSAGAVPQSDQYSLGIMLYEMLTGSLPFDGTSSMEIAMAHMSEPPPNPLEKNPDLSPDLVAILDRVLQKEPENRYPSCAALVGDLEKAFKTPVTKPVSPRVSSMTVSKQVEQFRAAHPSLSLPVKPSPATNIPTAPVLPAPVTSAKQTESTPPSRKRQIDWTWVGLGVFACVIFGIVGLLVVLGQRSNAPAASPTPEVIVLIVTDTPSPTQEIISTTGAANADVMTVTETPTPSLTITDTPADIPASTTTSTPRPLPSRVNPTASLSDGWTLFIIANADDSLYIVNQTDPSLPELRLNPLQITGENQVIISGQQWEKNRFRSGECVRIARNEQVAGPNVSCNVVGKYVRLRQDDRFWLSQYGRFFLSYRDRWSGSCQVEVVRSTGCTIIVPFSAAAEG